MVIKVFISGISGSKEVKKRQQRASLILDSCKVDYETVDITEPGMENVREFMQQNSKTRANSKTPIPPQFFNEDIYCGDYEDFDSAVEINQVLNFLKLEGEISNAELILKEDKAVTNGVDHLKHETEKSENPEENGKAKDDIKEATEPTDDNEEDEDREAEEEEDEEGENKTSVPLSQKDQDDSWGDQSQDDRKKRKKAAEDLELQLKSTGECDTGDDSWSGLGADPSKRLKVAEVEGEDSDLWGDQSNDSKSTPAPDTTKTDEEDEEEEEEEDDDE